MIYVKPLSDGRLQESFFCNVKCANANPYGVKIHVKYCMKKTSPKLRATYSTYNQVGIKRINASFPRIQAIRTENETLILSSFSICLGFLCFAHMALMVNPVEAFNGHQICGESHVVLLKWVTRHTSSKFGCKQSI